MRNSVEVSHNINFGLDKIKGVEKAIKMKLYTKVGVLGTQSRDKNAEGLTNADIGFVHEYGSLTRNIPKRSFLLIPVTEKSKTITKNISKNKSIYEKLIVKGNILKLFQDLGILAEQVIQEAFATAGFGKWKPKKIVRNGKTQPLIDTGQLRKSISSEVVKK